LVQKPHKGAALQDGQPLRRDERQWRLESAIVWLGYYRRLLIRSEQNLNMYRAFMDVACLMTAVRWL
jgi:hypothetical protein